MQLNLIVYQVDSDKRLRNNTEDFVIIRLMNCSK